MEERLRYMEYGKRSYDAVTIVQETMGRGFLKVNGRKSYV